MAPLLIESQSSASLLSTTESPPRKKDGSSSSRKRRVYFVEERNTVCEFEPIDNADTELVGSLWQQPWEMFESRQALKARARQWRTTGLGILLADTVVHCRDSNNRNILNPLTS